MEQNRAQAVLANDDELARAALDQPPGHRRPHRRDDHHHWPDRAMRPGHRRVPYRRQIHERRHRRVATDPPRLPRELELHPDATRHAVTVTYVIVSRALSRRGCPTRPGQTIFVFTSPQVQLSRRGLII